MSDPKEPTRVLLEFGAHTFDLLQRLVEALELQPARPAFQPSGPPAQARSATSGGGPVFRFGKERGDPVVNGKEANIAWYLKVLRENIEDPSKSRYRDDNTKHLAECEAALGIPATPAKERDMLDNAPQGGGDVQGGPAEDDIPF